MNFYNKNKKEAQKRNKNTYKNNKKTFNQKKDNKRNFIFKESIQKNKNFKFLNKQNKGYYKKNYNFNKFKKKDISCSCNILTKYLHKNKKKSNIGVLIKEPQLKEIRHPIPFNFKMVREFLYRNY